MPRDGDHWQLRPSCFRVSLPAGGSVYHALSCLLASASERGCDELVARHLVGVTLARQCGGWHDLVPTLRRSWNAPDDGIRAGGDFRIGDTVFRVATRPQWTLFKDLAAHLGRRQRGLVLVLDDQVEAGRQVAEATARGVSMEVESIVSFIGRNVCMRGEYGHELVRREFVGLLEAYNLRVRSMDADWTVLVEVPE